MKKKKSGRIRGVVRVIVNGGLLTACISYGTATQAAVNFQFEYMDAPGTGFLDPVNGPSWQAAMNTAANIRKRGCFLKYRANVGRKKKFTSTSLK